jgi:tripartite-type tricarboxylate transporter receptor subunit TctC
MMVASIPASGSRTFAWTLTLLLLAAPVVAQTPAETFPNRPITIIVPYTPGAAADTLMRRVGQKLGEAVKQSVIIDNRPGGGGNVGALAVKNAPPDGYTLFMGHSGTHVFNQVLFADHRFDPIKDFAMITPLIAFPCVLVVPADHPAKSVADIVAMAKSKPQGVSYASQGVGNTAHLLGEMFQAAAGVPLVHVPYRGVAPALADIISGRVDMMFSSYLSAGGQIEGGKLRMLAIAADKRSPLLPNVPTMAETGYPGVELDTWFGIMAPAGTPTPVVSKLHADFVKVMQTEDVKNLLLPQGANIVTSSPDEFVKLIAGDISKIGKLVREAGIKGDPAGPN